MFVGAIVFTWLFASIYGANYYIFWDVVFVDYAEGVRLGWSGIAASFVTAFQFILFSLLYRGKI